MASTRYDAPAPGLEPGAGAASRLRPPVGPLLLLLAVVGVLALPLAAGAGRSASAPRLPDLGVAPIEHSLLTIAMDGTKKLRFTVSIANVGAGPIEVDSSRPSTGGPWTSSQRIFRADGTSFRVATPGARMVFVGSKAHGHWHIRGAARYELVRKGSTTPVRIRYKRGFCLYDSTSYKLRLPGAPRRSTYPRDDCGKKSDLRLAMGVSVGWKDDYYWRIPGQEMDITNLSNGTYRLFVKADPRNWFRERNETNNVTWVDLRIGPMSVDVVGRSPRL
jgi:lysyl oxidase